MKQNKFYDSLTNEVKPLNIEIEQIGGHPSIEEDYYEYNLDTDYCRIHVFDNYFE